MIHYKTKKSLSKEECLSKREIQILYKNGKRVKVGEYLGIYLNNNYSYSKIGVSIKKKLGNAVIRNYEKRIIKEIFRNSKSLLPDVNLLIIKLYQSSSNFQKKQEALEKLFNRIK